VVLGDGDPATRARVADLLRSVGFDVREAEKGTEALQLARTARPTVVLLDVALPENSGYQVCHILRSEFGPALPILLFSADRLEPHDKAAGLLLGADDYFAKPLASEELLARVQAHARHATPMPADGAAVTLTPSELRVLRLLAGGQHTKGIASELAISPKTVSMHIHNAMKKLEVHSRTQAVALAHRLGLVDGGPSGAHVEAPAEGQSAARTRA
jgi:DNA-binding NarL/FixJ family response regulator